MTRSLLTRREFLALAAASSAAALELPESTTRSFWLFGLLRPECVRVHPVANGRLHCSDPDRQWIVEGSDSVCINKESACIRITGPDGSPAVCTLEVPGVLRRSFFGTFELQSGGEYVMPVVSMDCETATSCIVGAELPVSVAHFHALAAQAVISRSVLLGTRTPQHTNADFCDTTHCQFLRSPARRDTLASRAVQRTSGYVLAEGGHIVPARYSAACGGQTQSGFNEGHLYQSVRCEVCLKKRLARRGHGWGLCQEGAMELAQRGYTWRAILAKYYPNASSELASAFATGSISASCFELRGDKNGNTAPVFAMPANVTA